MKFKGAIEKWASGVLGAVCLVLLMNLLRDGVRAGGPKPALPPVHPLAVRRISVAPPGVKDALSKYDPEVKLNLLDDLQRRPLSAIARDPFEYPPPPKVVDHTRGTSVLPGPPPPPPPPPVTLKLIGYSEKAGGVKEAIIADEEEIYVVHEGDKFASKYRVTMISPFVAEIVDETTRVTVQLPIAVTAP